MADLRAGTTVGGQLVWTQGNFPLYPTGNTLLYKTFKIYSENDKPQAADNDFVSKANGGIYLDHIAARSIGITGTAGKGNGIALYNGGTQTADYEPTCGIHFSQQQYYGTYNNSTAVWATYFRHNSTYPWVFRNGTTNVAAIGADGTFQGPNSISLNAPTIASHLTRKDYVDGLINTTTTNANSRVLRSGDTMTGTLTAPNIISNNLATLDTQVPQLKQVVQKGVVLDYGTY